MAVDAHGSTHAEHIESALAARAAASELMFSQQADRLAAVCHRMAERFARGGRLIAFGVTPAARTDVAHVVVEFVHPVIVGKRALPALGLSGATAGIVDELALHTAERDIVIAFGEPSDGPELAEGVALAQRAGALTVAFTALGAECTVPIPSEDPFVRQELAEVAYHVLWELVHVFFEHRGLLQGRAQKPTHDAGPTAFLYPFLAEQETNLAEVLHDVAASASTKAAETQALRRLTLAGADRELLSAAVAIRRALDLGGRLLAFGNGGSATDAADIVVDFAGPRAGGPARPALDLTECSALITALGNDIGGDAILTRQLIAHGTSTDVLVVFSTSGGSSNVLAGLAGARGQRIPSVALVGYDGGVIAADRLADHIILTPSQHIPRIQEAQATVSHLLRELVEMVEP